MQLISTILTFIGVAAVFVLGFSTLGTIGYFLYLWGGVGLTLAVSAWTAFKLYIIVIGSAFLTLITTSIIVRAIG